MYLASNMLSHRLIFTALSSKIFDSENRSNLSSTVGGFFRCGDRLSEGMICGSWADELRFSGFSGMLAASPWMMIVVAIVVTETPKNMRSEGVSGV